ncbi:MAG: tRNA (adenosine(37)-N6)-threonylcarbamoyltransferase complex ATPase subunit type 1 TsaE [Candidatus Rokuibacteriota bacterium]
MRLVSESPGATREIGVRLGRQAQRGDVVALYGDLGVGKTCLIQGFAVGLGVEAPVTSPTFILIAEHRGRLPLYHVDLYRTEHLDEVRALGLDELIDGDGVTVIEWGDKAEPLLPRRCIRVRIHGVGDERRQIELEGLPSDWRILNSCPSPVSPRRD